VSVYFRMAKNQATLDDLRVILVENTLLRVEPKNIGADQLLFGPDGLGLDSIDALQLAVAVERRYGVTLKDPKLVRRVLGTLGELQTWINQQP
jgi:acyl carrier protein